MHCKVILENFQVKFFNFEFYYIYQLSYLAILLLRKNT